jgi:hypothetical protein
MRASFQSSANLLNRSQRRSTAARHPAVHTNSPQQHVARRGPQSLRPSTALAASPFDQLLALPKEALAAGSAALLAAAGAIGAIMGQDASKPAGAGQGAGGAAPAREDAVLVFGATGRAGRLIVQQVGERAVGCGRGGGLEGAWLARMRRARACMQQHDPLRRVPACGLACMHA